VDLSLGGRRPGAVADVLLGPPPKSVSRGKVDLHLAPAHVRMQLLYRNRGFIASPTTIISMLRPDTHSRLEVMKRTGTVRRQPAHLAFNCALVERDLAKHLQSCL
jgi:hypothetical protein